MNILFIGTADITASYIADRMYREGHSLTWITSEKKEGLWNKSFKGKVYREGYQASQISRILKLHSVDVIVFCFAGSGILGEKEENRQLSALHNTLLAVKGHPLKSFLYLSSVDLALDQVYSPSLAEYQYGENVFRYFQEREDFPLLILRLGMVYGDRDPEKMGYIGKLVTGAVQGQEVLCTKSREDYEDLLYGEDAAVAVMDLLKLKKTGFYNLISGHPIKMERLQELVEEAVGRAVLVKYLGEEKALSKEEYQEKSRPLKMDTGWIPFYLPEEKGKKALKKLAEVCRESLQEKTDGKKKRKNLLKRQAFREHGFFWGIVDTLAMFFLVQMILPYTQGSTDLRYVDVRLLFVVISTVSFGIKTGMFATVLACISYGLSLKKEGIDLTFLLYSIDTWIPFIVYGIAGAVFGYITDRKNDSVAEAQEKYKNIYDRYSFLKDVHKEALEVKGSLQKQISASKESFGKVYEVAQQLNTLSPDLILFRAVEVVADIMGDCEAALFSISSTKKDVARKEVSTPGITHELPGSLWKKDYPLLAQGFEKESLFVNRELAEGYPDFAAPIYRHNEMIAFLTVYYIPAERFTLYYQNVFRMVTGLIENTLVKAMEYEEKRRGERYLPDTGILNEQEFEKMLDSLHKEEEKSLVTYLQLLLPNVDQDGLTAASTALQGLIRDHDFAGVDKEGRLFVVLHNALESDLPSIAKRFAGRGLEVALWS